MLRKDLGWWAELHHPPAGRGRLHDLGQDAVAEADKKVVRSEIVDRRAGSRTRDLKRPPKPEAHEPTVGVDFMLLALMVQ